MLKIELTAPDLETLRQVVSDLYRSLTVKESPAPAPEPETPRRKFKVLLSPYPDINPGDVGEMMDELGKTTIALRFEKLFSNPASLERRELTKRIIAFERKHIEEIVKQ